MAATLAAETGVAIMMDWAGAQIWLRLPGADVADAMVDKTRQIALAADGRAVLVRAPVDIRNRISVFQSEDAALARINAKIRANFDPAAILNPGRMMSSMASISGGEGA